MLDRLIRFTVVSVFALAIAGGTAHAQDPCGGDPCADPCAGGDACGDPCAGGDACGDPCAGGDACGDPCGGDPCGGADGGADSAGGAWPQEIINRPLTLPKGVFSVGGSLDTSASFDVISLGVGGLWGASYGVSDELSVGLSYSLDIDPSSDGKGPLLLNIGYTFLSSDLTLAADVATGYDLVSETFGAMVGIQAWYNITPKISVMSNGEHLNLSFDPTVATFDFPVSVGFQATPMIFAQLDTNLFRAAFNDAGKAENGGKSFTFLGSDEFGGIPLSATAYYSMNNTLDIGVSFGFSDLKNDAGDNIEAGVLVTYYGGVK